MQRHVVLEQAGHGRDRFEDCRRLEAVDLVERDHDRRPGGCELLGDEAVAAARDLARVEHENDRVDVLETRVDGALHAPRERVERLLESGQVDEHDLEVVAVHDAECALPRRLRLVGHDRDVRAGERIRERRLADVRATRETDEAAAHLSSAARRPPGASRTAVR